MGKAGRFPLALAVVWAGVLLAGTAAACAAAGSIGEGEGQAAKGAAQTGAARSAGGTVADYEAEEGNAEETNVPAGADGNAAIEGTEGDDTIQGTEGDDAIDGGGGDDLITALAGADVIDGGAGADTLYAGPYDADPDTLEGGDGDDTLLTFDLPASKDTVRCGAGADEVKADSLDEAADDCEDVDMVRETEPDLAEGTYELVPSPSSECSLGKGTMTVGVDPATGQRGVEIRFGPLGQAHSGAPEGTAEECGANVDYETPVTERGEPAAQETMRRAYEGEKPPRRGIDEMEGEARNMQEEPAPPAKP